MIAEAGGLIGVGFWADVTCGEGIDAIVSAIRYGIDHFGLDHIALGSDWDGSVTTPIGAAQLPHLTQALLDKDFTERDTCRHGGKHGALPGNTPTAAIADW